jgi:hypothetical protein
MDLSSTYASLYNRRFSDFLRLAYQFTQHVYRTGKTQELSSFLIWELQYRLGLFRRANRLTFTQQPVSIQFIQDSLKATTDKLPLDEGLTITTTSIDWKYCFEDKQGKLWGCEFGNDTTLITSVDHSTAKVIAIFPASIRSLYVNRAGVVFVCAQGILYRGKPDSTEFTTVLSLTTPESYFLFNRGITELPDGTLLLGEYASIWTNNKWTNLANLYIGTNEGLTWQKSDFLIRQGVNKHIHLIQYASRLNQLFLTDGDNKKQIWRNQSCTNLIGPANQTKPGWRLLNRFHIQTGGYTSMVEHEKGVVFGTDYLGGTNFLIHTTDGLRFEKVVLPDPYRRSPVINMVRRQIEGKTEIWALLHNSIISKAKCLLMRSTDYGRTWARLIEYDGCKHEIQLVSTSHGTSQAIYFCIRHFNGGQEISQTYRISGGSFT